MREESDRRLEKNKLSCMSSGAVQESKAQGDEMRTCMTIHNLYASHNFDKGK